MKSRNKIATKIGQSVPSVRFLRLENATGKRAGQSIWLLIKPVILKERV